MRGVGPNESKGEIMLGLVLIYLLVCVCVAAAILVVCAWRGLL